MIQANELRIDNVFYFAGGVATISGIFDLTQVWVAFEKKELKINLKKLNPIPITPEILESAGFKRFNNELGFEYKIDIPVKGSNKNEIYFFFSNVGEKKWGGYTVNNFHASNNYVYLHQLQNLYFALTGQELKLNLHATV